MQKLAMMMEMIPTVQQITNNDSGGEPGGDTDNTTDNEMGDEDDHDPEEIFVDQGYDLALNKVVGSTGPFNPGDDVVYFIEVCNQGNINASNIEVTDYLPTGLTLSSLDFNGWTASGSNVTNTISSLIAGECETLTIILAIDANVTGTSIVNYAEISSDDGDDIDSTPDSDDGNDAGGASNTPSDDATDGNGTGTPGDTDPSSDEDDHDPAEIQLEQSFDLALVKALASQGPFNAGDDVVYSISVINQGSIDAAFVEVSDYIPTGMSLSTNDTNGWATTATSAVTTIVPSIPAGETVSVDIILTIDATFAGGDLVNYAEISEDNNDDVDSDPDNDPNNDAGGEPNGDTDNVTDGTGGDEDDHDPELISVGEPEIFDLALTKMLAANQSTTVVPGDFITYDITVYNQGDIIAQNIEVVDYLPTGMTLADTNWTTGVNNTATTLITGSLAPNASTTVSITVELSTTISAGSLTNYAEISNAEDENGDSRTDIDSSADNNDNNDGPATDDDINNTNGDEDDHDPATINIEEPGTFDLALTKSLATGQSAQVDIGDVITYEVTVYNQGEITAQNVEVIDYLPIGMEVIVSNWIAGSNNTATTTIAGPIAPGGSETVSLTVQVMVGAANGSAVNYAEITGAEDENGEQQDDIDSTPDNDDSNDGSVTDDAINNEGGDEDDHDPAEVFIGEEGIFDLALVKAVSAGQPNIEPGDLVNFDITVINQGTITAQNVEVIDYLPTGMTLADANWTAVSGNSATTIVAGPIAPGQSMVVTITVQLSENITSDSLINYAEIANAEDENGEVQDDIDSTPDDQNGNDTGGEPNGNTDNVTDNSNNDEDDHDPAIINFANRIFDLALVKELSIDQVAVVAPGDLINYDIIVYNQGEITATNVSIVDYLPPGSRLLAAGYKLGRYRLDRRSK